MTEATSLHFTSLLQRPHLRFSTLNTSCHSLLACRVSAERSAVNCMEFPLYVTCCFSLAAFNILSLCLIFVNFINMCLGMFLLWFILYGTLCFLDLIDYFLSHVGEIFFFYFNWRLITLKHCGGFCHTFTWIIHGCTCVPHPEPSSHLPPNTIPPDHPGTPTLSTLSHASNLDWWYISHMIIYIFQCCSLKSSHPCLLPESKSLFFTSVSLLLSCI